MKVKKLIAPIAISLVFILFWGFFLSMIWIESSDMLVKIFMTIPFAAAIGCMIFVLLQRIQEIKGGNEDDLDNY